MLELIVLAYFPLSVSVLPFCVLHVPTLPEDLIFTHCWVLLLFQIFVLVLQLIIFNSHHQAFCQTFSPNQSFLGCLKLGP